MKRPHCTTPLIGILLLAALLRAGALWHFRGDLSQDRDAYLAIAENLAAGRGYSVPGSTTPTAYRPPLYPLILAGLFGIGGDAPSLGLLHLALATATVFLTYRIGRSLGSEWVALAAAGLVAVDPLLVRYTALPMTETLFTFLVALLLVLLVDRREKGVSRSRAFCIGLVFGLGVLCRPVLWAFGALMVGWWIISRVRARGRIHVHRGTRPWLVLAGVLVAVLPWGLRNLLVLGHPVVTTTHGGYTLLLGNNPVFYEQVVSRPWGTVWADAPAAKNQQAWYHRLRREMAGELGPHATEVQRDRWMYGRAWRHITHNPGLFARACWLRLRRFWNVVPLGEAAEAVPAALRWGTGLFYGTVMAGMLFGLLQLKRTQWRKWMPPLLLILGLTLVHLVFWSNARMRAPLVPAVAVLAAFGGLQRTRFASKTPHGSGGKSECYSSASGAAK